MDIKKIFSLSLLVFVFMFATGAEKVSAIAADIDPDQNSNSGCIVLKSTELRYRATDAKTGGEVSLLQDFLQSKGYLNVEPTGYFGLMTFQAVKSFQKAFGFSPTGYVGPLTRAKINELSCGGSSSPTSLPSESSSVSSPSSTAIPLPTTTVIRPLPCTGGALFNFETGKRCATDVISTPLPITVLSPNGGESWVKGTTQTIKWQDNSASTGGCNTTLSGQVYCSILVSRIYDIKLAPYNTMCRGNICPAIALHEPYTIASNVSGFSYTWSVGNIVGLYDALISSGTYRIQICQSGTSVCDSSDNYFNITSENTSTNFNPEIVGFPAIPANIQPGQTVNISLSATDQDNDDLAWTVDWGENVGEVGSCSEIRRKTGTGWTLNKSHSWASAGVYQVKVKVSDCVGGSDSYSFSVTVGNATTRSITVLSPNGGESWVKGTTQTITWQDGRPIQLCVPTPGNTPCVSPARLYNISLTQDNSCPAGVYCVAPVPLTIAQNVSGSSYQWAIPTSISPRSTYRIGVCSSDKSVCDESNSTFTITSGATPPPICAEDMKQCSNGTWVSRVAPNCEFASCPVVSKPIISSAAGKAANNGEIDAGGLVGITGTNLAGYKDAANVYIGGVACVINQISDTLIYCTAPTSLVVGSSYGLYVKNDKGISNTVYVKVLSSAGATKPSATILTSSQITNPTPYIIGTASGVSQVGITLSNSGGKVYSSGWISVVNGNWSVTVYPALALGQYTISVYDVNNNPLTTGSIAIVSSTQPSITVLSPNGDSWSANNSYRIRWSASSDIATIRLANYLLGSSKYGYFAQGVSASQGYFDYTTGQFPQAGTYTLELEGLDKNNNFLTSAKSTFSITAPTTKPSISVSMDYSSPAGLEVKPGQANVTLAVLKLAASGDDVGINQISVGVNPASNGSVVNNIGVYDGSTLIGSISSLPNTDTQTQNVKWGSIQISPLVIVANTYKKLTLRADISSTASGVFKLGIVGLGYTSSVPPTNNSFNGFGNQVAVLNVNPSITISSPTGGESYTNTSIIPINYSGVNLSNEIHAYLYSPVYGNVAHRSEYYGANYGSGTGKGVINFDINSHKTVDAIKTGQYKITLCDEKTNSISVKPICVSSNYFTVTAPTVTPTVSLDVNGYSSTGYSSPTANVGTVASVTINWSAQNATRCNTYGQSALKLTDGTYWNFDNLPTSGTRTFSTSGQKDGLGNSMNSASIGIQCWNGYEASESKGLVAIWTVPTTFVCAEDMKQCSNGTWVSRVAPSCEFASCPVVSTTPSITSITPPSGSVGTSVTIYGKNLANTSSNGSSNHIWFNSYSFGATNASADGTSVTFAIPSTLTPGTYQVSVKTSSSLPASNSFLFTVTAANVATPTITVKSPNGGEVWTKGNSYSLTWMWGASVPVPTVMVDLIRPGFECHLTNGDVANNGYLHVNTSNCVDGLAISPASDYKIRVMHRNSATEIVAQDESDGTFSIVAPTTSSSRENMTANIYDALRLINPTLYR